MTGLLGDAAGVDRRLDRGDDEPLPELGDASVAEVQRLREVVAGVDVDDREREAAGPERLLGESQQHDRVLAAAEQQRRALEDGRGLPEDVDRLRLDLDEVRDAVALSRRDHAGPPVGGWSSNGPGDGGRDPRPDHLPGARVEVDAALAAALLLPPPASGSLVLAGLDGPRARRAADRRIAAIVERVVRQVALPDVRPDLVARPVGERSDLPDAFAARVRLGLADLGTGRRLVAAKAGDPAVDRRERAPERLDLPDVAALAPVLDRVVEEVQALGQDHLLDSDRVGEVHLDVDAVAAPDLVHQVVGLLRQAAGVEREHSRAWLELGHEVDEDGVLGAEGRRERQPVPADGVECRSAGPRSHPAPRHPPGLGIAPARRLMSSPAASGVRVRSTGSRPRPPPDRGRAGR